MRDFYCEAIIDTATWRPDDAPTSREALEREVEEDGTAAGLREDAIRLGQNPDAAVRDYVSGMLYAIEERVQPDDAAMHTLAIRSGLSWGAADILLRVRRVMNEAEEMSGPEGEDYLKLMQAIATDASTRADDYAHILKEG